MGVSVTNGGAMELIATGNVAGCFQVISNELSTTKILICPADTNHEFAANFDVLDNSHISYFVSADVTNENEEELMTFLDGDDNFERSGFPVKSGLINVSSNTPIAWTPGRHNQVYREHFWSIPEKDYFGTIGVADGSVEKYETWQLQKHFQYIEPGTNRLAIP